MSTTRKPFTFRDLLAIVFTLLLVVGSVGGAIYSIASRPREPDAMTAGQAVLCAGLFLAFLFGVSLGRSK
jgi:hypothetical protein